MPPNNIPFIISFVGNIATGDPYYGYFNFGITKTNSKVNLYMKNTEANAYNEAQEILDVTKTKMSFVGVNSIRIHLEGNKELKIYLDRNVIKSKKLYTQIKNLLSPPNTNFELTQMEKPKNNSGGKPKKSLKKKPKKSLKKKPKKLSKKKSTSKSTPKKHIGSRGGVYIIRKGRKIYQ